MKTNNWRTPLLNWEKYSCSVKMMRIFKNEDCDDDWDDDDDDKDNDCDDDDER